MVGMKNTISNLRQDVRWNTLNFTALTKNNNPTHSKK